MSYEFKEQLLEFYLKNKEQKIKAQKIDNVYKIFEVLNRRLKKQKKTLSL